MTKLIVQMGKRGTLVIPAKVRKALGLTDGSFLVLQQREGYVELHPAQLDVAMSTTVDAKVEQAQQLLNAAQGLGEYLAAIEEVRRMGLEPEDIPHDRR
jgi:AbrB family looped-hinge helix DNA binding protein